MRGRGTYRVRVANVAGLLKHVLTAPRVADVLVYDKEGRLVRRLDGLTKREKPLSDEPLSLTTQAEALGNRYPPRVLRQRGSRVAPHPDAARSKSP